MPSQKMDNFRKSSATKIDTLFDRWWFFFLQMAGVYVWKSKGVENMQDYTHFFGSLGIFNNWWKNVFSQPLQCIKISVRFVIFFSTITFVFFLLWLFFLIQKKLKIYEDSYFAFFKDRMLLNMSKKIAKLK